jgi:hypothetical protein
VWNDFPRNSLIKFDMVSKTRDKVGLVHLVLGIWMLFALTHVNGQRTGV